jgi:hypothetical protein
MPAKKKTDIATAPGKTYYPAKTFDDDLVALVDLFAKNKWSFSGVDLSQLKSDTGDQRAERKEHDAAEIAWNETHHTFGVAQAARAARFSSALNAARGAFKNDARVRKQLERFKRSVKRGKGAATPVTK